MEIKLADTSFRSITPAEALEPTSNILRGRTDNYYTWELPGRFVDGVSSNPSSLIRDILSPR